MVSSWRVWLVHSVVNNGLSTGVIHMHFTDDLVSFLYTVTITGPSVYTVVSLPSAACRGPSRATLISRTLKAIVVLH